MSDWLASWIICHSFCPALWCAQYSSTDRCFTSLLICHTSWHHFVAMAICIKWKKNHVCGISWQSRPQMYSWLTVSRCFNCELGKVTTQASTKIGIQLQHYDSNSASNCLVNVVSLQKFQMLKMIIKYTYKHMYKICYEQ